jgi:hypothetical protein
MRDIFFLKPLNLGGSIEHYFHFLFGYLIPFVENTPQKDDKMYLFKDCGPVLNPIIMNLPDYTTGITRNSDVQSIGFFGYDSPEFPGMDMESIKNKFYNIFKIKSKFSKDVVVIDRCEPHPFYSEQSQILTSGNSRRSVPNMRSIYEEINKKVPAKLVCLEGMNLGEQIELFSSHRIFVLQHGASMSNLIFSRKKSFVIEIRSESSDDYYAEMKSRLGIYCDRIAQENDHANVDPNEVLLSLKKIMTKIF